MSKRFLTRELIICKAFKMIDESGLNAFSVRGLAAELGVQVSSLYNHIHNENDLLIEVAKRAGDLYTQIIKGTMYGLPLDEATVKAGDAFSDFVTKHKYLYELLLDRRLIGTPEFDDANKRFTQPIYYILEQYGIKDKTASDHLYVMLRTVTHGFASLDALGIYDGLSFDPVESYRMMMNTVIGMMKELAKKDGNNQG